MFASLFVTYFVAFWWVRSCFLLFVCACVHMCVVVTLFNLRFNYAHCISASHLLWIRSKAIKLPKHLHFAVYSILSDLHLADLYYSTTDESRNSFYSTFNWALHKWEWEWVQETNPSPPTIIITSEQIQTANTQNANGKSQRKQKERQKNNNNNNKKCTNEWTRFSLFSIYVVEHTADP